MKKRMLVLLILLLVAGTVSYSAVQKEKLLITKKPFVVKSDYSEKNNGWGDITFATGVVLPFNIVEKDDNSYKIKKMDRVPFNIGKDKLFTLSKDDVEEITIDLSFLSKIDFTKGLKYAIDTNKEMERFLKGKTQNETDFYRYMYIQEYILYYSKQEREENAEKILNDYFTDDTVNRGYKYIIMKNPVTYDMLLLYKPLILRYAGYRYFEKFADFVQIFKERGTKSTRPYKIATSSEIDILVKNFEISLENLSENEAYKDILYIIGQCALHKLPQIQNRLTESSERLKYINIYISILLKNDINSAKIFINDVEISEVLRTSLIINLIDLNDIDEGNAAGIQVRGELEKSLSPKSGIDKYIFQILPASRFLGAVSVLTKEIERDEVSKMMKKELMEHLYKKYGEYMGLNEVNRGSQLFMYLLDYYIIVNAAKYAKAEQKLTSDGELLVFSSMYASLKNKEIYLAVINDMKKIPGQELAAELLSTAEGLIMQMEIDNIIYSPIVDNEKTAGLLPVYMQKYDLYLGVSSTLSDNDLYFSYINKKTAVDFIIAKELKDVSRAKDNMWRVLTEYPGAADDMISYLSRVSAIFAANMTKNNPEYKAIIDEAVETAERFRKKQ